MFDPRFCAKEETPIPTSIDLAVPSIPLRSTLISLEPFGKKTNQVESLWSYLHRVADAHSVRFFDLFVKVFAEHAIQLFGRTYANYWNGRSKYLIVSMNGAGVGQRVALLANKLTGRTDLLELTLADIGNIAGLTIRSRGSQAWCPLCFAEDEVPYARLAWSIDGVTHCARHRVRLESQCPSCDYRSQTFSSRSDVFRCVGCGVNKDVQKEAALGEDEFGLWLSCQIVTLMDYAHDGRLVRDSFDTFAHNIRCVGAHPEVGSITRLGDRLGCGRNTALTWIARKRAITMMQAGKLAWAAGVPLCDLYSRELRTDELRIRNLPESLSSRKVKPRLAAVPQDSPQLYLTALRMSSQNPFQAPLNRDLVRESGVHLRHPAFSHRQFRLLMGRLRFRERIFYRRERVWREICDVHNSAAKVAQSTQPLTRRRVASGMIKPGRLKGTLARAYLDWFIARHRAEDGSILSPKLAPLDVRAFWSLQSENKK